MATQYRPVRPALPPAIRWGVIAGESRACRDQAMRFARQHPKTPGFVKMARRHNHMMLHALAFARMAQS